MAQAFSAEDPESLRGPQFDCRLVRRAGEVALCGSRVRHAAVRAAARRAAAPGHHDHAAADSADQAADRRSGDRGDARADASQRLQSVAGVSRGCWRATPARGLAVRRSTARSSRTGRTRCGRARCSSGAASRAAPPLQRIVVAIDPPVIAGKGADACGIVAAGRGGGRHRLRDRRRRRWRACRRRGWAAKAIALWRRLEADALVAEVNQGGDMVTRRDRRGRCLGAGDRGARDARQMAARRAGGDALRAGPGQACRHVSPRWKTRCATSGVTGLSSGRSPDRLDALVWAVTSLTLAPRAEPRVRELRGIAPSSRWRGELKKGSFDRYKTFLAPPETKASRTAKLLAFESGGRARWTPRDYAALARERYLANAIVHRAS